jgi:hypothetical protein
LLLALHYEEWHMDLRGALALPKQLFLINETCMSFEETMSTRATAMGPPNCGLDCYLVPFYEYPVQHLNILLYDL